MKVINIVRAAMLVFLLFFSVSFSASAGERSEGEVTETTDCSDLVYGYWTTFYPGTLLSILSEDASAGMTMVDDGTGGSCWIPSSAIEKTASQNEGEFQSLGYATILQGANCYADPALGTPITDFVESGESVHQLADGSDDGWQLVDLGYARCFIEKSNFEEPVLAEPEVTQAPVEQEFTEEVEVTAQTDTADTEVSENLLAVEPTPEVVTQTGTYQPGDQIVGLPSTGNNPSGNEYSPTEPATLQKWMLLLVVAVLKIAATVYLLFALYSALAGYCDRRDEINPKIARMMRNLQWWCYYCPVACVIVWLEKRKELKERRVATT